MAEVELRQARLILLCFLLAVFRGAPSADTWYITPDGTGDAVSIQHAIDVAAPGDTVLVADGLFTGLESRNLHFNGKILVLRSEHGPDSTILDAEGIGRCILFQNGETRNLRVEGITFRGGAPGGGGSDGGAVYCSNASPVIQNCRITGSTANDHGGGLIVLGGRSPCWRVA